MRDRDISYRGVFTAAAVLWLACSTLVIAIDWRLGLIFAVVTGVVITLIFGLVKFGRL